MPRTIALPNREALLQALLQATPTPSDSKQLFFDQVCDRLDRRTVTAERLVEALWQAYIELSFYLLMNPAEEPLEWGFIAPYCIGALLGDRQMRQEALEAAGRKSP